ncbi:MAG: ATP-grasp domain-containing protein [Myxococcota bacterium]
MTRSAWLLNLDAEDELAGRPVARARLARFAARVALPPGDLRLRAEAPLPEGVQLRCWSPTPGAMDRLRAMQLCLPEVPSGAVLSRVLHRAFALEAGASLPGQSFHRGSFDAFRSAMRDAPLRGWRWKLARSYAGRGQRRVARAEALTKADRAFAERALAGEGLLLEPEVDVVHEAATHGYVRRDGAVATLPPVGQRVVRSTWRGTVDLHPALASQRAALRASAAATGRQLHAAGYWGPFGVDAYLFRDGAELRLNARGEVNARWTMSSVPRAHALLALLERSPSPRAQLNT